MNPKQLAVYLEEQAIAIEAAYKGMHYFDTMAQAYRQQQQNILKNYGISLKQYNEYKNKRKSRPFLTMKTYLQYLEETRNQTSPYMQHEDPLSIFVYDIKQRQEFYKIKDNYWDTMKLIMHQRAEHLSTEELEYINEQIDKEFSMEYLKALVGLK